MDNETIYFYIDEKEYDRKGDTLFRIGLELNMRIFNGCVWVWPKSPENKRSLQDSLINYGIDFEERSTPPPEDSLDIFQI